MDFEEVAFAVGAVIIVCVCMVLAGIGIGGFFGAVVWAFRYVSGV